MRLCLQCNKPINPHEHLGLKIHRGECKEQYMKERQAEAREKRRVQRDELIRFLETAKQLAIRGKI